MLSAAQPLLPFSLHSFSKLSLGNDLDRNGGVKTRGLVALATGSTGQSGQRMFGSWAQGPGSWSKLLVVHMVVNDIDATGPA